MLTKILPIRELEFHEARYWSDFYRNAGLQLQKKLGLNVLTIEDAICMAASGMDILAFNRAIGAGLTTPMNKDHLDEIIDFYRFCSSTRFFLQLTPEIITSRVWSLLETSGFRFYNNWCKYYKELKKYEPVPETDLKVALVKPDQVHLFAHIMKTSFGIEYDIDNLMASTWGKRDWHYYFAMDGDKPVAAASMCIRSGHAMLTLGATLPEARNRGAQSLLIATRTNDAIELGARYISTETAVDTPEKPSPSSRNMKSAGFELLYLRPNFIYEFKP